MLKRLYSWYGKKVVNSALFLVVILVIATVTISKKSDTPDVALESKRIVNVSSVTALSDTATIELIGEVEAVNQATIQSEVSGSVTSVSVSLGDSVRAGQIIGQVDNASERAAVLQAEGSYEASLAAAAQGDSSVTSAETNLINAQNAGLNTYRTAFTTTDNVIRNTVDQLFSNPTGAIVGFALNTLGKATELNETRKSVETILIKWSNGVTLPHQSDDALTLLTEAEADLVYIANFVELVANTASDEKNDDEAINGTTIEAIRTDLNGARENMNSARLSVENAIRSIENAESALIRAEIAGQNSQISSANAQVKQSLGALRAAEANLAKTIFRAPISGTVNTLSIKKGDFINSFTAIASIANNNAFEVTTYVGEVDRDRIQIGDPVRIDGKYDGVIANIAPAVDPITKKVEVKIQSETDSLSSGDSVKITITADDTSIETDTRIFVPLTAVKFSSVDGSILMVKDGIIESREVSLGEVSGSKVEITDGLSTSDVIIIDARGLNAGREVETNQI